MEKLFLVRVAFTGIYSWFFLFYQMKWKILIKIKFRSVLYSLQGSLKIAFISNNINWMIVFPTMHENLR